MDMRKFRVIFVNTNVGSNTLVCHFAMKYYITTIILGLLNFHGFAQLENGVYKGLERMCWTNDKGKVECFDAPHKWYHLNTVYIRNDTMFLYKEPIMIRKKDTTYSASDGAFYYYFGKVYKLDTTLIAKLTMNNCDYCGRRYETDTSTGFQYPIIDTVKYLVHKNKNGFSLNGVNYLFKKKELGNFPERLFYFDENSIYRTNPKEQYKLISQSVQDFLKSDSLKLKSDTIIICPDRFEQNIFNQTDTISESLNPTLFHINNLDKKIIFLSFKALKEKVRTENKPFHFIQIGEIIDYKNAARITLTYKIILPQTIKGFSERQYHSVIEYNKTNNNYVLQDEPFIGFELIEK